MKAAASIIVDDPAVSSPIVTVAGVSKTYASGLQALKRIDLTIRAVKFWHSWARTAQVRPL